MISRAANAQILEAARQRITSLEFFGALSWIDDRPLLDVIEGYRRRIFTDVLDTFDPDGRPRYNLALNGRAKKNWKSADLILAALDCLLANDSPGGNQCYLLANDEEQAGDNLELVKKLIRANPLLAERLVVKQKVIERVDGRGFLMILPAQDVVGSHGKTYRFCGVDELHGHRTWDLLEAMQLDPTRPDALMWITSYASIYHRPGVPLFDLCQQGRAGTDPRLYFSWYAADFTTDLDFVDADPETRANPSRGSWADTDYLAQQMRRLPAHKARRLHLNLPGLPEGSAYTAEMVMEAFDRGVTRRHPEPGLVYSAANDMSGGSNDDATLAIASKRPDGTRVLDVVMNQGPPPPFDPRHAVGRFAEVLRAYGISRVTGDAYGGQTFREDFRGYGIEYVVSEKTTSQLYEALEPLLNAREVRLLDVPILEQQLLGLVWRGSKIDHQSGEHDDFAAATAGALVGLDQPYEPVRLW
jgi:phage terminase large subunit-like protein